MAKTSKTAGIGDDAVRRATGKGWDEWFAILDRASAAEHDHRGIVAVLSKEHSRLGGWWTQMITVAYEQARGLREKHQKPGGYEISGSKTVGVPVAKLYRAFNDGPLRRCWLDDPAFAIRTATPSKSMRITWVDGRTSVSVNFWNKGAAKSQVSLNHGKLRTAAECRRFKTYWAKNLARLKVLLEGAAQA